MYGMYRYCAKVSVASWEDYYKALLLMHKSGVSSWKALFLVIVFLGQFV